MTDSHRRLLYKDQNAPVRGFLSPMDAFCQVNCLRGGKAGGQKRWLKPFGLTI